MRRWINYHICICRSALPLAGCFYNHFFANRVVAVLITYLTSVLTEDSILKSVAIVNGEAGFEVLVMIIIQILGYASESGVKIILSSTFAYCMGLLLLYLASVNRIPHTYLGLYIIAAFLLAIGRAGVLPILKTYLGDQLRAGHEQPSKVDEKRVQCRKKSWLVLTGLASISIPWILSKATWPSRFIYSTSMIGATYILLLFGIPFYHQKKPTEKSCNVTIRVFAAALRKRHLVYPHSRDDYLKNDESLSPDAGTCAGVEAKHPLSLSPKDGTLPPANDQFVFKSEGSQLFLLPKIRFLRCLDRAAIIEPLPPSPKEQQNAGRLCTVSEVKEGKLLLMMIPMWSAFILFYLVQSTANTFFSLQEKSLKAHKILFTRISIFWLLALKQGLRAAVSPLWKPLVSTRILKSQQKQAILVRICLGMMVSVLCLAVAWRFEVQRLRIVNQGGLAMTNLRLVPQFCLWGLMEGLAITGLDEFVNNQVSKSMEHSDSEIFNTIPDGIGSFLNGLCVYACRGWFANTLNLSRLDKYLHMITVLAFINFVGFFIVVRFYTRMKTPEEDMQVQESAADAV